MCSSTYLCPSLLCPEYFLSNYVLFFNAALQYYVAQMGDTISAGIYS